MFFSTDVFVYVYVHTYIQAALSFAESLFLVLTYVPILQGRALLF
jgi:hypothetical protein